MMGVRKWLALSLGLNAVALVLAIWAVGKLGGWRYLAHRLHTTDAWPTYMQRVSQLELLPPAGAGLLFLGDSHVAYGAWDEWLPRRAVYNRGVPAEATARLLASSYLRKTLGAATDTVVLQVGTNDLLFGHRPVEAYAALVDTLVGEGIVVYACTLPGVNNRVRWTGIDPGEVVAFNEYLRGLGSRHPRVTVVDLATALETEAGVLPAHLTDDGVHLRGDGYRVWVRALEGGFSRGTMLAD